MRNHDNEEVVDEEVVDEAATDVASEQAAAEEAASAAADAAEEAGEDPAEEALGGDSASQAAATPQVSRQGYRQVPRAAGGYVKWNLTTPTGASMWLRAHPDNFQACGTKLTHVSKPARTFLPPTSAGARAMRRA